MKKLLICALFALSALNANASAISDGAIVKTADNPDVYIVKYNAGKQYKRLVLNPLVFQSYGHLKWENLLTVSQEEMDSFVSSDLVRVDGSTDIYQLSPNGDTGDKYLLTSTQGYDTSSIYTINLTDFNNYVSRGTKGIGVKEVTTPAVDDEADKIIQQALEDIERKAEAQRQETERLAAEAANAIKAFEGQQKLDRLNWGISATSQLTTILQQTVSQMDILDTQLTANKAEIDGLKNKGGLTTDHYNYLYNNLSSEYNNLAIQYNSLLERKNRIVTIGYEIDDYVKYGTIIPAVDRSFLNSLGINV